MWSMVVSLSTPPYLFASLGTLVSEHITIIKICQTFNSLSLGHYTHNSTIRVHITVLRVHITTVRYILIYCTFRGK